MALDPFAAIKQPPQFAKRPRDGCPERILHGVHCAHLVGHRADAADARGDVRRLRVGAAAQESLEEARRLEDAELRALDGAVADHELEPRFALDAREVVDLDGPTCHGAHSRCETPRRWR